MEPEVLFQEHERNGVAWAEIVLNRPDKGNALTLPMLDEIERFVGIVALSRRIRALVLRAGGRFFSTGGDIEAWGSLTPEQMANVWILRGIEVFNAVARLPQPVIAAIHGHALGGGLEFALMADLRVAVAGVRLGLPEVGLGMIAGWSGIRRIAETSGVVRARELTLLGAPISAETALDWGLVNAVAADRDAMDAQIDAWLEKLLSNAPIAMALTKKLLATMHAEMSHDHAEAVAHARATEDCNEGIAAFRQKRKPVFRNR
ncbi:MAG: enoyl-CoA hydratase/isomerase family protein [Terracidiphilus sp.]